MDEPIFRDKKHKPTETELEDILAAAKPLWDEFLAYALETALNAKSAWKHYAGPSGWMWIIRDRKRNIAYLKPCLKFFRASFAFSDIAVEEARKSKLPAKVLKPMIESKRFPEGRPARIEVKNDADLRTALKMLNIKLAH